MSLRRKSKGRACRESRVREVGCTFSAGWRLTHGILVSPIDHHGAVATRHLRNACSVHGYKRSMRRSPRSLKLPRLLPPATFEMLVAIGAIDINDGAINGDLAKGHPGVRGHCLMGRWITGIKEVVLPRQVIRSISTSVAAQCANSPTCIRVNT
ncbi:hypothetical protein EV363DRAFT_453217 [Boletus edulis]|nr:hypothetical protein EV363DRAFT_453217 [Boletus edulis]